MTQEEKAKAYDEALKNMRKFRDALSNHEETDLWVLKKEIVADIEYYFPELKESEEERVKRILHSISSKMSSHLRDIFTEEEFQCFDTWSNAWLEKQGEQKPIDKVEPKFKIGDWIACEGLKTTKIVNIDDDKHEVEFIDGNKGFPYIEYVDRNFHLWTIQDAKDGDVLVTTFEEDNMIVMYHSMCTIDTINVHCCLDNKFVCWNLGVFDAEDVKPATKKQRDILFEEMQEKGYEWDAEKKELKKIDDKPLVIDEGKAEIDYCFTKMMNSEKVSSVWSEEDECYMTECINAIATMDSWSFEEKRKTKH